jgi:hypothetical protein
MWQSSDNLDEKCVQPNTQPGSPIPKLVYVEVFFGIIIPLFLLINVCVYSDNKYRHGSVLVNTRY